MMLVPVLSGPRLVAESLRVASLAHAGQLDALGAPYMGHVNRVWGLASRLGPELDPSLDRFVVASAAILHDVVEDSSFSLADLGSAGVPEEVLGALDALTHRRNEPRADYLARVMGSRVARVVKVADTLDNADPVRMRSVALRDPERAARLEGKYRMALDALGFPAWPPVPA